jgi:hypothetical protein
LFAQSFNYHGAGIQLRLVGLVVMVLTVICLGILELELGKRLNRRQRTVLIILSGIGSVTVFAIAYISTNYL